MAETALACTITSPKGAVQIMTYTITDTPVIFTRTRPTGSRRPAWTAVAMPDEWARDPIMLASFLQTEVGTTVTSEDVSIEGWFEVPIDTDTYHEIVVNGAVKPAALTKAVEDALKGLPPVTHKADSLAEATTVVAEVIDVFRQGGDVSDWTSPPFAMPPAPAVGGTAGTAPITLTGKGGEVYLPRTIPALGMTDIEYLSSMIKDDEVPALLGVPGTGKTAMVMAALQVVTGSSDLVVIACDAATTKYDLLGTHEPTDTPGKFVWVDGILLDAVKTGKAVLVDEFMRLHPTLFPIFYGLMDGRRTVDVPLRGTVHAHENFRMVMTSNPDVPGATVDQPLFSRFSETPTVCTDWDLVRSQFGADRTTAAVISACENLDTQRRNRALYWSPQHREVAQYVAKATKRGHLIAVQALIAKAGYLGNEADQQTLIEVLSSMLGTTAGLQPTVIGAPLMTL